MSNLAYLVQASKQWHCEISNVKWYAKVPIGGTHEWIQIAWMEPDGTGDVQPEDIFEGSHHFPMLANFSKPPLPVSPDRQLNMARLNRWLCVTNCWSLVQLKVRNLVKIKQVITSS